MNPIVSLFNQGLDSFGTSTYDYWIMQPKSMILTHAVHLNLEVTHIPFPLLDP